MIRGGLRRVLDTELDLRVVAEAGDVEAALRQTRKHRPQIVVLDLNMPAAPSCRQCLSRRPAGSGPS
jgi:DNA-binding NarL/FixJ family response regulator